MRYLTIVLLVVTAAAPGRAQSDDARQLAAVLASGASAAEKEAACLRLKEIGTAGSVPALAALLADERLSQWARDALETMPFPEAGEALVGALEKTAGRTRAGIIGSLGARGEAGSVPRLIPFLADPDPITAAAAATALGKVGGAEAASALKGALARAPGPVRVAVVDALLACADRVLAGGDKAGAATIYHPLNTAKEAPPVRAAAFRGVVLSTGAGAAALVAGALKGDDAVTRDAALALVRQVPGREATTAFAALISTVPPDVRVPLIEALVQRGDTAAQAGLVSAARAGEPEVRAAALEALGTLGDASHVPLLAEAAGGPAGPAQNAARQALARLNRGDVCTALLAILPKSRPAVQSEIIASLTDRGEKQAVPALLKMTEGRDAAVAAAATRALARLAGDAQVDALLKLLVGAKDAGLRDEVEAALVAVAKRSAKPEAVAAAVLGQMPGAGIEVRCSLLRAAGPMGGAAVLDALRAGVKDPNELVRDTALRTMADCAGVAAMPDLLSLARQGATTALRVQALRGYWRLVGLCGERPAEERLAMCRVGMDAAARPEERRSGLAELAKVPLPEALRLAQQACADAAVRGEAEQASVQIAARLLASDRDEAAPVLRRLAAEAASEQTRADARAALAALDQLLSYVMPWLAAGPYRQEGKECQQLFDIAFAPEKPDGGPVQWRPAPTPADAALFWQVDLGPIVAGNHAVAYIKTRVYSPRAQAVVLEMGADDGIKVWVNGELVHANNAVRSLTPGQDRAQTPLKQGWNDFLVKVTQHTVGCGACIRLTNADGTVVEGLRVDPKGE